MRRHHNTGSEESGVSRRSLLVGGGAAVAAGAAGTLGLPGPAGASSVGRAAPLPKPIPGGVPADPADPTSPFLHFFLPGPTDAVTPIIGLEGMGLDVESSLITDFHGDVAFAVVAGEALGNDGNTYGVEFDVRVMSGTYIAENGTQRWAKFAFL